MGGRRSDRIAGPARFGPDYGQLFGVLLLGTVSCGSALVLGAVMERLAPVDLHESANVTALAGREDSAAGAGAQTSVRLQRVLDLWFDEPNLRHALPGT
jgi:hypothetical protein